MIKEGIKIFSTILFICLNIYGCYWVAKTGSYFFFYEGMVKETIQEMVKPEALK
jgi:hypothetical protein